MVERVIGYKLKEVEVIISRPTEWGSRFGNFRDLKPITAKRTVLTPIYEDLGPKVNTTMEDPIITIRETPLWGINTDDATGKHKGNRTIGNGCSGKEVETK